LAHSERRFKIIVAHLDKPALWGYNAVVLSVDSITGASRNPNLIVVAEITNEA
jgi:hypothetical protein